MTNKPENFSFAVELPEQHGMHEYTAEIDQIGGEAIGGGFYGVSISATEIRVIVDDTHVINASGDWRIVQPDETVQSAMESILAFYQQTKE